jgi:hypothetical protein
MFQVIQINLNKFEDFKQSLWNEQEKIKEYCSCISTDNLQTTLNTIFNPGSTKEKLNLNTVDVLFTRDHTYQLVYSCEEEVTEVNYLASVINYKRKPIKGIGILVKVNLSISDKNKLIYKESPMTIDQDIGILIKDLFYHNGFKISSSIEKIEYDNKYVITDGITLINNEQIKFHDVKLFGIPFRIWYVEGVYSSNASTYLKDLGLYLNKKIKEVYVTCCIYPQCKALSLDIILVKQFIDLISTFPDEGELRDIEVAYNFASKNDSSENVYIVFGDFYNKVMREERS